MGRNSKLVIILIVSFIVSYIAGVFIGMALNNNENIAVTVMFIGLFVGVGVHFYTNYLKALELMEVCCEIEKMTGFEKVSFAVVSLYTIAAVVILAPKNYPEEPSWLVLLIIIVAIATRIMTRLWNDFAEEKNNEAVKKFIDRHKTEIEYLAKIVDYDVHIQKKYVEWDLITEGSPNQWYYRRKYYFCDMGYDELKSPLQMTALRNGIIANLDNIEINVPDLNAVNRGKKLQW